LGIENFGKGRMPFFCQAFMRLQQIFQDAKNCIHAAKSWAKGKSRGRQKLHFCSFFPYRGYHCKNDK